MSTDVATADRITMSQRERDVLKIMPSYRALSSRRRDEG